MLEKIILLSVSYFCVGTELRFLSNTAKDQKPVKTIYGETQVTQKFSKADSEIWHAMALETSGTFLPSECPLVSHVIMSYQKHHSPALTTIPEDEPLFEELKVVRPLNEIKNDQINYHQIIRAYNTSSKNSNRKSVNYSRPISSAAFRSTPSKHQVPVKDSKIGLKKHHKIADLDLQLLEPEDDNARTLHSAQESAKSSRQNRMSPSAKTLAQQYTNNMKISNPKQSNHIAGKPPISSSRGAGLGASTHSRNKESTKAEAKFIRPRTSTGHQQIKVLGVKPKLM